LSYIFIHTVFLHSIYSKTIYLDRALCENAFFSTISFFLVFKRDFIERADFTRISALNTASDDVTN